MYPAFDNMADKLSERTFIDSIVSIDRRNEGNNDPVQFTVFHPSSNGGLHFDF